MNPHASPRDREIVRRILDEIGRSSIGPYEPLSKAVAVAGGLVGRLDRAHLMRNSDPGMATEHLIGAFAAWPILCRVMAELEAAYPEAARRGGADARRLCALLDRRDGKGDHA